MSSVCGIVGTVLSGYLSDKLFRGNRITPAIIMILFGLSIGVLICYLGGLMATDIAPKKASGAALSVVFCAMLWIGKNQKAVEELV